MAYEIGTATDYKDLLDRLRLFATDSSRAIDSAGMGIDELDPMNAEDVWTVKRWNTNWDALNGYELILSGPGVTGSDNIYVGIQTYYSDVTGYYNWMVCGMTGFTSGATLLNQPGIRGADYIYFPHVFLNNTSMKYWFVGNGRRLAGVVKVAGTYYATFYLGYFLPYGTPAEYPYPLMIGGSAAYINTSAYLKYSSTYPSNTGWPNGMSDDAYSTQTALMLYDGEWRTIGNHNRSGTDSNCVNPAINRSVWPYVFAISSWSYYANILQHYGDISPGSVVPLWPMIMYAAGPNKNVYGEPQGFYAVLCDDVVTEDTVTIDGKTYIVFQLGSLTNTYFAMLKE